MCSNKPWNILDVINRPRQLIPDSKVHGANMEPIWGQQDPGGLHVGPMNFAIWDHILIPIMIEIVAPVQWFYNPYNRYHIQENYFFNVASLFA